MAQADVLLEVKELRKYYPPPKQGLTRLRLPVKAVDGVDFSVREGETLGLVGESGCGKTTVARVLVRLDEPTSGTILYRSRKLAAAGQRYQEIDIAAAGPEELRRLRRHVQLVFQDPYSSLNPRMTVEALVGEPFVIHGVVRGSELRDRVAGLLEAVGLNRDHMRRYPHEFSGGQRQRIGIARALALNPELIVADEPVSALDVSIQAQVINLLKDLQHEFGLTYLFIAHDLSMVRYVSDRLAVMYLGRIVELGETEQVFAGPKHPYTEALLSAVPIPNPHQRVDRAVLSGEVPSPINAPAGCHFHPRCPFAHPRCSTDIPGSRDLGAGHRAACHFAERLQLRPAVRFEAGPSAGPQS